jgi:hypothetical protein
MGSLSMKLDINTEEGYSVVLVHSDTPVLGTLNIACVSHVKKYLFLS